MFKQFVKELKDSWKQSPLILSSEILGTLMGITAALLISVFTVNTPFLVAYTCFLIASLLLSLTAYKQKNSRLLVLNSVYTVINIIGVYNGIMLL